ncbi:hypothetical protein H4Q26_011608 [Puccinia striiformis f. sp. tritici PST-130]|nr:hypothetical protein H4Q26_011608 [Puccinia striiformis f. sp. tritici PST-130]
MPVKPTISPPRNTQERGIILAPSEEPRAEASDSSGSTSTQVKTTSLSAERRCTVLLEVPSDFDPGHPAVDGEPSSYYDPQPGITSGHTDNPTLSSKAPI